MTSLMSRTAVALLGAIALTGTIAGCGGAAPSTAASDTATDSTGTGGVAATYTDGEYTESGNYVSPDGPETVDVTVTLENDVVTAVTLEGHGDNPNSKRFQGLFAGGIAAAVVGKNIDELSVDKVAGSSLTSGGFNDALDKIRDDARQ